MRYYKIINENNKLLTIGIGDDGEEITEAEYNALMTEIQTKWGYINKLVDGIITADEIPSKWREEIQAEAEAIIKAREEAANQPEELSPEEEIEQLKAKIAALEKQLL